MTFVNDRHRVTGRTHLLGSPGYGEAQTPASEPWLGCPGDQAFNTWAFTLTPVVTVSL